MKPVYLAYTLQLSPLILAATLLSQGDPALSQASDIVPDNTLGAESSQVIENAGGQPIEVITGGAQREQNLFHSFQEFNVSEGRGAIFANPEAVTNIFSRVTGDNVSNILGALGVSGAANLYLINPNGIVFGENSSLNVQGSFTATTADGIEFGEQGFFSASNPEAPKLLTINPSAYLFNQAAPGAIANYSQASADLNPSPFDDGFFGLRVPDDQSLLLLGGNIIADGGGLVAIGGQIEIGAIADEGTVEINNNGSLNIPDNISRGDVSLTNGAGFLVAGDGGGDIAIAAENISLDSASSLTAGILYNLGSPDAQAGDINLDATDVVNLIDGSEINNNVAVGAIGNSGNIDMTAESLTLTNGAFLDTRTSGEGNAGNVLIEAKEITFSGSTVVTEVSSDGGEGNAGDINISTNSLSLQKGSSFLADTENQGNAGNILINAENSVVLKGRDNNNLSSQITSTVDAGTDVNTGKNFIGVGDAGNIVINTGSLSIADGGFVSTSTFGDGNGGNIFISADNAIALDASSYILNNVQSIEAIGNAGTIEITTGSLSATKGSQINSYTRGQGNAGNITIQATEAVTFDGFDSNDYSSAFSSIEAGGVGSGGDIKITAGSLSLTNGAKLNASVREASAPLPGGEGQGGDININVDDTLTIGEGNTPRIVASLGTGAKGQAGNINIQADNLVVKNGGQISSSTSGEGDSGDISITANNAVSLNASSYIVNNVQSSEAVGNAGNIEITTGSLSATKGSQINSYTRGQGNAGDITIQARDAVTFDGADNNGNYSSLFTSVEAGGVGSGGDIKITAGSLSLTNGAEFNTNVNEASNFLLDDSDVNSSTPSSSGNISILTSNLTLDKSAEISTSNSIGGNSGDIDINTAKLKLNNGSNISTISGTLESFKQQNSITAGKLKIRATDSIEIGDNTSLFTTSAGFGNGGDIFLDTKNILIDGGTISSSAVNIANFLETYLENLDLTSILFLLGFAPGEGISVDEFIDDFVANNSNNNITQGDSGNIVIEASESINIINNNNTNNSAGIITSGTGNAVGGDISISTPKLNLQQAIVTTSTAGAENSGKISIQNAETVRITNNSRLSSQTFEKSSGNAGNIEINTKNLYIENGGQINSSTFGQGDSGNILITADNAITLNNSSYILNSVQSIDAVGNAGKTEITTSSLSATNGSQINSYTRGQGDAGDITIQATNSFAFDGVDDNNNYSSLFSSVEAGGVGNGGDIKITTGSLSLTNGAKLNASVREALDSLSGGKGDAGNLTIYANSIQLNGGVDGLLTGIFASVEKKATGDGGSIFLGDEQFPIQQLTLSNGAQIVVNTFGEGDAGNLFIFADNIDVDGFGNFTSGLFAQVGENATGQGGNINFGSELSPIKQLNMTNGASISVSTFSVTDEGNAGNLSIFSNSIELNGEGLLTGLFASAEAGARGQGGNIVVDTDSLTLTDGGRIAANVEDMAEGNGGTLEISANDSIVINGTTSEGAPSAITSVVNGGLGTVGGIGNAGAVTITTSTLSLINGGRVSATSLGKGNGGDLDIYASESIFISGFAERFRSGISASAFIDDGNSGDVNISTNQLNIENGGTIEASNFDSLGVFTSGTGEPGNININANSITLKDRGRIDAATQSDRSRIGNSANINLKVADSIILRNNSFISAQAFSNANGGNIIVDTEFIIAFPDQNNDIIASAEDGDGGNISITAESLFGIEERPLDPQTNDISASSNFGLNGNVSLNVLEIDPLQGTVELPDNLINTNELVANSCLVPSNEQNGTFVVTGGESLPVRPGENIPSKFSTGEVRSVPEDSNSSWQHGDPIIEPQGAYRLANGKVVLSRECSQ